MKKPRTQPAFADLTEAELEQLANWLRHETYEIVLDRVRKPRAEGGFGLTLSRIPLERLYAKVALLNLINARLSEDKKLTLTQLETAWVSKANAQAALLDYPFRSIYRATRPAYFGGVDHPKDTAL